MSNALATSTLMEGIRSAVVTAWGILPISIGRPRVPIAALPYAVLIWNRVDISSDGPGSSLGISSQKNRFTIIGRFPFPTDPADIIDLEKVSRANSLIAALQSGPDFAEIGFQPLVTSVESTEPDPPSEKAYEVTLTFEVSTVASHT